MDKKEILFDLETVDAARRKHLLENEHIYQRGVDPFSRFIWRMKVLFIKLKGGEFEGMWAVFNGPLKPISLEYEATLGHWYPREFKYNKDTKMYKVIYYKTSTRF